MHRSVSLLLAALVVAGCAPRAASPGDPAPPVDLRGEWVVTAMRADGEDVALPPDAEGTLVANGRRLGGTSFCNGFGADYRLAGDRLEVRDRITTLMACPGEVARAEGLYGRALDAGDLRVAPTPDGFTLTGDGVELRLAPRPPVEAADLTARPWLLTAVVAGPTASSPTGEPAVLEFGADGTFRASTGCRPVTGRWTITGGRLTPTDVRAERECPGPLHDEDAAVLAVLGQPSGVRIARGVLTLTGAEGRGLQYAPA
ncbi:MULTISPECIES: META domain-containing protein [unclassified Blastococcus]